LAKRKRERGRSAAAPPPPPAAEVAATPDRSIGPRLAAVGLIVLVAIFAMIRLHLLDLPLERDEGEYAYTGQLILHGIAPYKLAYNMKWPGTYAAYALIMAVFGQTIAGIRIGMLLVTSATAVLLYFLTARLFGRAAGVVAAATQLLLSITIAALAPFGHATHFVALCAVAGYLLLTPREGESLTPLRIAGGGALIALAAVMKQPGMFFGLFAALLMLDPKRGTGARPLRDTSLLAGGAAIVLGLMAAILAMAGVFGRFKFWTIDYARQYVSEVTIAQGLRNAKLPLSGIYHYTALLCLFALLGLVLLFLEPSLRAHWKPVIALFGAGALATTPGLYFREHYFIVLFPAMAMFNGIAVAGVSRLMSRHGWSFANAVPLAVFFAAFVYSLSQQWPLLVQMEPMNLSRIVYGANPFAEAIEVGNYLREHTAPNDRIAVIGSEPEIYFYAGRKSATGYLYTYPLMEQQSFAHRMQLEMISEIERNKPKYFVMVSVGLSWIARPESDMTIFEWSGKTANNGQWVLDGVVDITPYGTKYAWGEEAQRYRPTTRNVLMVFKRK
jgi:hypothetical protein